MGFGRIWLGSARVGKDILFCGGADCPAGPELAFVSWDGPKNGPEPIESLLWIWSFSTPKGPKLPGADVRVDRV